MSTNEPSSSDRKAPTSQDATAAAAAARAGAKKLSEAEYLHQQADEAKAAIGAALADARSAMAEGLDPREWTRRYPLVAVGSALAAGFVATVLAIPSHKRRELKQMEKLRAALHPEAAHGDHEKPKPEKASPEPSFWFNILRESLRLIRPVLLSAVTAAFSRSSKASQDGAAPRPTGAADDATAEARRHHV
jgi:hypothetical protein